MAKNKAGRPPWNPSNKDRAVVQAMARAGIPEEKIAAVLRTTKMTLRKHCSYDLKAGHTEALNSVAQSMYKMAVSGPYSVRYQAAKYWLACQGKWREDDRPAALPAIIPVAKMSDEDFYKFLDVNGIPHDGWRADNITPFPASRGRKG